MAFVSGLALAGCDPQLEQASIHGREWFIGELTRIGYTEKGNGLYGTPPTANKGPLGDALELQVRDIQIVRVTVVPREESDGKTGVTWRGQVALTYQIREQYYLENQPRGWGPWVKENELLNLERRLSQWYVSRAK